MVKVRINCGCVWLEVDSNSVKDAMKELGPYEEVFSHSTCGACGSTNVVNQVREVDRFTYYERSCTDCRARLQFGQHQTGHTLFPKKKDSEGNWLPNNGWTKWEGNSQGVQENSRGNSRQHTEAF